MPYRKQFASKVAHGDIIRNPEVADFLSECEYLRVPSDEEGKRMVQDKFLEPVSDGSTDLPLRVVSFDGSYHESSIDDKLPSTKVGYVKVGCILIEMEKFNNLRRKEINLVDPFRVAALQRDNDSLTFSLPSANIRLKGKASVRDSFRAALDAHLHSAKTRFLPEDPTTSLRTTLFHLASRRQGVLGTNDVTRLKLHKCPSCEAGPLEITDTDAQQNCPQCKKEIYPSDCLRIWEEVSDFQSNIQAMTRLMMMVEHMLPIHYIRYLLENDLECLSKVSFFIDGPLAIFGNCAWLHGPIMSYIDRANYELTNMGLPPLLIIGLQKTGQVVDHVTLINRFVENNRLFCIDDDYRYNFILTGRDPAGNGFGSETYYGQDYIYKTPSGRFFVFALPYPFPSKKIERVEFHQAKLDSERYPRLEQALRLIQHFECDLYDNSVIPVALAHKHTAISLVPGGQVLDLLTRRGLASK